MSNILKELRTLEAKRNRGVLSQAQFDLAKADLFNDIPEISSKKKDKAPPKAINPLWDTLALWLLAATLCGAGVWAATGNMRMAATLGITVLAAFTVQLFGTLK